jgi:acetyltransferase-like isoleucine patch superfamily enzyme
MQNFLQVLKKIARATGLSRIYWFIRKIYQTFPIYFPNFIFQRILRVNGGCPWSVHYTSKVMHSDRMKIHSSVLHYFAVSGGCYLQGTNGLVIDEGTIFAWGVKIISANHNLEDFGRWDISEAIHIGKQCWLGTNSVILPGVQLGDRVIVAAGSVVNKSFPSNRIIGGVPARELKVRISN